MVEISPSRPGYNASDVLILENTHTRCWNQHVISYEVRNVSHGSKLREPLMVFILTLF